MLNLTFRRLLTGEDEVDVSGHANPIVVRVVAKGIIFLIDQLASADWSSGERPVRDNIGNKI